MNSNASIILGFTLSVVISKLLAVNRLQGSMLSYLSMADSATPQELITFPSDNFYRLFAKLVRGQAICQIDLQFDHVITTRQPQGAFFRRRKEISAKSTSPPTITYIYCPETSKFLRQKSNFGSSSLPLVKRTRIYACYYMRWE